MIPFAPIGRPAARAGALVAVALAALTTPALAAPPALTKEECVDAHGKGQDAREGGQLVQAGKLFLACAQPACPELVQRDCARFADELERQTPSVTFAARDGAQNDLPDTSVSVDGALVAARLGDGKAHDLDPGRHVVRFVHGGKELVLEVVVSQGEKGRALVAVFPSEGAPVQAPSPVSSSAPRAEAPEPRRPAGPLVLVGLGAAAAVAGGALLGAGLAKIPATCSLATHQCAAPPQDPVFERASSGVQLVNVGAIVGAVGVVTLGSSLIWYFAQSPRGPASTASTALVPWVGPRGAGLSFSGCL